jgi:hypothetical protein
MNHLGAAATGSWRTPATSVRWIPDALDGHVEATVAGSSGIVTSKLKDAWPMPFAASSRAAGIPMSSSAAVAQAAK